MADEALLDTKAPVMIVGVDASGNRTNTVNASSTGDMFHRDIINTAGVTGIITGSNASVEAKAGTTHLLNRKYIEITPTNGQIYFSLTSPATSNHTPIPKGSTKSFSHSENVPVYIYIPNNVSVVVNEAS